MAVGACELRWDSVEGKSVLANRLLYWTGRRLMKHETKGVQTVGGKWGGEKGAWLWAHEAGRRLSGVRLVL